MPDPLFDITTARFDLPLLFAGQAQKELYVNEAFSRIDALLQPAIEGQLAAPPTLPADGQTWLVAPSPTGDWAGRAGDLAVRQAGQWVFVVPRDGLRVLNRSTGQFLHYDGAWSNVLPPASPVGGSVIDIEARSAIAGLVAALRSAGIFAET